MQINVISQSIVGDASGCFLSRSANNSHNSYEDMYLVNVIAIIFAKDKHKSHGTQWLLCIASNNNMLYFANFRKK